MSDSRICEVGTGRFAHASGALWIPASRTVFIADIHLGYTWAMRRRRQLGPMTDGGLREKLISVVTELSPVAIVLLGDIVHAPKPGEAERRIVENTLRDLAALTHIFAVRGNHDRAFARDFENLGMEIADRWEDEHIVAIHGDQPFERDARHVLMGHIHPAVCVVDHAGASQRVPVFLASEHVTVLPAFSPFAAGVNVRDGLPPPLDAMIHEDDISVFASSGKRVIRVGPLRRLRIAGR
jgi:uncharacterized protein